MKKTLTICLVVCLGVLWFVPTLFGADQYSYRFEKLLELIDYYYLQPNNVSREQIKDYNMVELISAALIQQSRYKKNRDFELYKEFEKDLYKYLDVMNVMGVNTWVTNGREDREESLAFFIEQFLGKDYKTEGDQMPSFDEWERNGFPAFEIAVRPIPPPEPIKEKPSVANKKQPDKKAIELLEIEGESTEDLETDNDYWPVAPDIDEFSEVEEEN